jgi:hypothetical protein
MSQRAARERSDAANPWGVVLFRTLRAIEPKTAAPRDARNQ